VSVASPKSGDTANKISIKDFNDQELEKLLSKKKNGVIYALSPLMHFSLDGIPIIKKVAKELDLELSFVCDPESVALLPNQVKPMPIEPSEIKVLRSLELFFRGMGNHYPSIIVYSKDQSLSGIYPGLKAANEYTTFIREFLK
jgi:hypothetical protein